MEDQFNYLIEKDIEDGHIVIAACNDDCVTNLNHLGKQWFANMGSYEINYLKYRQPFAFIGFIGRR